MFIKLILFYNKPLNNNKFNLKQKKILRLNYRPEIDGLRAIAVCSVIIYHAKIKFFGTDVFQGGYLGVDIFFVISGYLISSIIFNEIRAKKFSLLNFYERRVRRIIPALFFVIIFCIPFAYFIILVPIELVNFSESIISTIGFFSNYYFFNQGQEYGATNSLLVPFLHSWSLSVEEQFYILFPILIIFIFRFCEKYFFYILFFIFILSLAFAEFGSNHFASLNFYILLSRIWEIFFGSLLAYFESIKNIKKDYHRYVSKMMPTVGIFIIGLSILAFNGTTKHPSIITLFPVIGTGLIIWFSNKGDILTKILSTKFFVSIGAISYSLYLWHYPIFAFSRITSFASNSLINKMFLLLIIILFSIISYYFIECPARKKNINFKKIIIIIFSVFLIICSINIFIISKEGFSAKYNNVYLKNDILNDRLRQESWKYVNTLNNQEFIREDKIKILIIGDSFSKDLFNLFYLNKELFNKYEFIRYGNKFNKDAFLFDQNYSKEKIEEFEQSLLFKKSDFIIISDHFLDMSEVEKLRNFIIYFKSKKKIILTSNSNIYQNDIKHKRFHKLTLFDYYLIREAEKLYYLDKNLSPNDILKINQYYFENRVSDKVNMYLKKIAKNQNLKLLDKNNFMCDDLKKLCYGSTQNGFKTSYDGRHFTIKGAEFFGKKVYNDNWFEIE